jgi:hypothetical protein
MITAILAGRRGWCAAATLIDVDDIRSGKGAAPVVRLSTGATGGAKVAAAVLILVPLFLSLFVVGMVTFIVAAAGGADNGQLTPAAIASGAACLLLVVGLFGFLLLRVLRTAFWLEGTTVVNRRSLSTRRADLAVADVAGDAITVLHSSGGNRQALSIPAVLVRDPRSGILIKIPLKGQGLKRLPAWELNAIADAIMAVRRPDDPSYPTAEALTRAIREMAANPFPV